MTIPKEIKIILNRLQKAGFQAYIVGGCVRDFLLGREPDDWDVTCDAGPKEIQEIFPDSFYENNFLTVTVKTKSKKLSLAEVQVTTFRSETGYSDKRHPDQVSFAKDLREDLSRRDFTINAMAMDINKKIFDFFEGQEDLKKKNIKTVGQASQRFEEDALRILRAVRLAVTLDFSIDKETVQAITQKGFLLNEISRERIRDEFLKIIMSDRASDGVELLRKLDILKYILPELQENYGVGQNKHHIYDCYTHAIKALEYAAKKNFSLSVRLASLLHDIGKPRTKKGQGPDATFYNHEIVGAKMAKDILSRLKLPAKDIEKIAKLIQCHMFYYNIGEVTESSIRRLMRKVGPENMEDLLRVRQADRIGSGVVKAEPYKLRHLRYIIDKVSQDPISVRMLKVNGKDVMEVLGIHPGPKVGWILDILLGIVLEDPKKNKRNFLISEIKKIGKFNEKTLQEMANKSKEEKYEANKKQEDKIKKKHWVK